MIMVDEKLYVCFFLGWTFFVFAVRVLFDINC